MDAPQFDAITTAPTATGSRRRRIRYHGGPIMHGTINVYFIWYGS